MDLVIPDIKSIELDENTRGRDIFVGDIHGHYPTLIKGLEALEFNEKRDRLIAVGDLIDRGPDSLSCLRLLKNDWFFSCLGNHEQMFYQTIFNGDELKKSIAKRWQNELSAAEVKECLMLIEQMPLAITIKNLKGVIGVAHAGVPFNYSWQEFIDGLSVTDREIVTFALYDRNIRHQTQSIQGVDYVFVGHQGLEKVQRFGNQICIDTAVFIQKWAGESYGLTFAWLENDEPFFLTECAYPSDTTWS